jgi:hypothetical protein
MQSVQRADTCSATHWCDPFSAGAGWGRALRHGVKSVRPQAVQLSLRATSPRKRRTSRRTEFWKPTNDDELRSTGRLDTVPGVSSPGSPCEPPGGILDTQSHPEFQPTQLHLKDIYATLPNASGAIDTTSRRRLESQCTRHSCASTAVLQCARRCLSRWGLAPTEAVACLAGRDAAQTGTACRQSS